MTLKVTSGNFIRFEVVTGARCNVLPLHIYKKATGDFELKQVTPTNSYDDGNTPVLGTVILQVWRGSFTCLLLRRLVESKRCRPILEKSAREGIGVVEIKDFDAIHKLDTSGSQVFSVHTPRRGQFALRSKIKERLEELHSSGVIDPVSRPTPWLSSMLAIPKKIGTSEGSKQGDSQGELSCA